jgi:hypothetical protein
MGWHTIQRLFASTLPLWLYHYTDNPRAILDDMVIRSRRFGFVGATENPNLWRFEGNERSSHDLVARIALRNTSDFRQVEYTKEWFDSNPDEVDYITNSAWERAGEMGATENLDLPDNADDEDYDEAARHATDDFVFNAFEDKSDEAEWLAESPLSLRDSDIAWVDVRDAELATQLRLDFPAISAKIRSLVQKRRDLQPQFAS